MDKREAADTGWPEWVQVGSTVIHLSRVTHFEVFPNYVGFEYGDGHDERWSMTLQGDDAFKFYQWWVTSRQRSDVVVL